MDQRAHDVEEDLKNILRTRMALGDKIQSLEQRVEETVRTTKTATLDAIDRARDHAARWVESTAQCLDPSRQAARRPWVLLGTAVAVGLFVGLAGRRGTRRSGVYPYYPPEARGADVMPPRAADSMGRPSPELETRPFTMREREPAHVPAADDGQARPSAALSNLWQDLTAEWAQERARLEETALLVARSFIRDLTRLAGDFVVEQLGASSRSARRPRLQKVP
ncbi:MAG TPA: hypothetical protein VFS39_10555 [Nitrospira sp.]|nr:hypothetical protein [Nitrospira sp.]